MMQGIEIAGFIIPIWFYVTVIYVLWVCLVLLVKRLSFRHIRRLAKKTATKLDDIFIRAIDLPVNLLAGAYSISSPKRVPINRDGDFRSMHKIHCQQNYYYWDD